MAKQHPIEIFMPPNVLKAKVGGGGLDASVLERAEQAVAALKEEFGAWVAKDVARLAQARADYEKSPGERSFRELYRAAHDLRGQGTTFDFPLITRVATSLCALGDGMEGGKPLPQKLIDAHVNAIHAVVRNDIRDPQDATASVLAAELERQVSAFLEKHGAAAV
jgi:chemotaxis protein histidine kinase CheA